MEHHTHGDERADNLTKAPSPTTTVLKRRQLTGLDLGSFDDRLLLYIALQLDEQR
ncbi:hypothetical protein ACLEB0_01285 [Klebsiella pneumoniae]